MQRPLWASTSAKNPNYRDVVYAEALIGPDTVDTMPPATIEAFLDHGVVAGDTVKADYAGAHRVMEQLAEAGIDMDAVTQQLLDDGVKQFADSYDQLIRGIAEKIDAMASGYAKRQHFDTGRDRGAARHAAGDATSPTRIWHRDPNLWKPGDAAHAAVIHNRLGWLDVIGAMREQLPGAQGARRARCARPDGATACCSAWAAPASAPRCCAAPSAAPTDSRRCTCSTPPIRSRSPA